MCGRGAELSANLKTNPVVYPKPAHAASPLLGNARALAARGGAVCVAIVHAHHESEECSRKRSRLSIVQSSSGC